MRDSAATEGKGVGEEGREGERESREIFNDNLHLRLLYLLKLM